MALAVCQTAAKTAKECAPSHRPLPTNIRPILHLPPPNIPATRTDDGGRPYPARVAPLFRGRLSLEDGMAAALLHLPPPGRLHDDRRRGIRCRFGESDGARTP